MRHTMRALVVDEVTTTLEETINGVRGGGDDEVIVVGEGDRVDEGSEKRVDGVFIDKTRRKLRLGVDLHKSNTSS